MANTAQFKRIEVPSLVGSPVSVVFDREWEDYRVKVAGKPAATYYTNDRADALATAQRMRNTIA